MARSSRVPPRSFGVADDLPVAGVDEQADVVPRRPDAHAGQVAAYMGARRPAAEAARDDVRHVGLVDRPGVHLEPLPAVCAGQAVLPHDAADAAPADGNARPPGRRLDLARSVPALLASIYFSPFSPTYFRQSRQRGCAGFANADAPLSASRLPPPSRPRRRWIRPSGGTTVPLS